MTRCSRSPGTGSSPARRTRGRPIPKRSTSPAGWCPVSWTSMCTAGAGCDYATEDPQVALAARAFHAAHGTTSTLASLVTAAPEVLARQLATIADLVDDGYFAGAHLEGPFLSPAQPGAHEPSLLRTPDPGTVDAADHRRPWSPRAGHARPRAAGCPGSDHPVPRRRRTRRRRPHRRGPGRGGRRSRRRGDRGDASVQRHAERPPPRSRPGARCCWTMPGWESS